MKPIEMTPEQAQAVKELALIHLKRGISPNAEYSIVLKPEINRPAFLRTKATALAIDDIEHHVFYKLSDLAGIEEIQK